MSKVCISCGLKVDNDGGLAVATSGGTYEDVYTCGTANGGKVYCSSSTGELLVDPPSMYREWKFVTEIRDGSSDLTDYGFKQTDDLPKTVDFNVAGGTITNPSKCRPMYLFVDPGIQHGLFSVDSGGGGNNDFARGDIQIESYASLSPAPTVPSITGGHQHWGGVARGANASQREIYRFDTSGAYLDSAGSANGLSPYVLAPGASLTVGLMGRLIVIRYATTGNGKVTLENWRVCVRIRGWAGP